MECTERERARARARNAASLPLALRAQPLLRVGVCVWVGGGGGAISCGIVRRRGMDPQISRPHAPGPLRVIVAPDRRCLRKARTPNARRVARVWVCVWVGGGGDAISRGVVRRRGMDPQTSPPHAPGPLRMIVAPGRRCLRKARTRARLLLAAPPASFFSRHALPPPPPKIICTRCTIVSRILLTNKPTVFCFRASPILSGEASP
jgi:hypothetical protein